MANANFDTEELFNLGMDLGIAFSALYDGFQAGREKYHLYMKAAEEAEPSDVADHAEPEQAGKTEISDCRACWCDRCLNIEVCRNRRDGVLPEGETPFPCIGCRNGMRFKPEEEPPCAEFEESGTRNNG